MRARQGQAEADEDIQKDVHDVSLANQVKHGEGEDPDQVNKVPAGRCSRGGSVLRGDPLALDEDGDQTHADDDVESEGRQGVVDAEEKPGHALDLARGVVLARRCRARTCSRTRQP